MRRRNRCKADPAMFCQTYFPDIFWRPFDDDQMALITAIRDRIQYGGSKAFCMRRGGGKTSITRACIIYAICYGLSQFVCYIGANGPDAGKSKKAVMHQFERNELLLADFPEICAPIRALQGAPSRARMQTVAGRRTHLEWSDDQCVFPDVVGSQASGTVLTFRGIEAAIRGMLDDYGHRPDLVIVDDVDTEDSAKSQTLTTNLVTTIDNSISALGGPGEPIAIIYPCTILAYGCCADIYTDPNRKPSWEGVRYKAMPAQPANMDMWEHYFDLRRKDQQPPDPDRTGRTAHQYYLDHRPSMDVGAVVTNPYAYDTTELPDGTLAEASSLQNLMNIICDKGWDHFNAEFQGHPPQETVPITDIPTVERIRTRTSGVKRGYVPAGADYVVAAIDVHKYHLDWCVMARCGVTLHVVDYGEHRIARDRDADRSMSKDQSQAVTAETIYDSLCELAEQFAEDWPVVDAEELMPLSVALVDANYNADAVHKFCRQQPTSLYRPCIGEGSKKSQARYRQPGKGSKSKYVGNHYYAAVHPTYRHPMYHIDDDYFKRMVHSGLSVDPSAPNSIMLWGDAAMSVRHHDWATQITAEVWTEQWVQGKGNVAYWDEIRRDNHALDAAKMCLAAAVIKHKLPLVLPPSGRNVEDSQPDQPQRQRNGRRRSRVKVYKQG